MVKHIIVHVDISNISRNALTYGTRLRNGFAIHATHTYHLQTASDATNIKSIMSVKVLNLKALPTQKVLNKKLSNLRSNPSPSRRNWRKSLKNVTSRRKLFPNLLLLFSNKKKMTLYHGTQIILRMNY